LSGVERGRKDNAAATLAVAQKSQMGFKFFERLE